MNAHEKVDIIISNFHRRIFEIYGRKQREVALVIAEYLRSKEKEIAGIIEKYEKEEIDAQRLKADLLLLITRNKTYSTLVEQSADDITAATVEIFELMPKYEKEAFEVSYEEERLAAEQDYTGIMMLSVAAVLGGFAFRNTLNRSKESRFVKRNLKSAFTSRILTFGGEYTSPYKFNTSITRSVKEKAYKATKDFVNKISWDSVSHAIKKNINFARNVTRTKMTYWENRGRQTVYTALNKMGIDGVKIWVTMDDSRVREAHAEMDGVRVPLEDPFICEGYEMMYPGDMSGGAPASLTYNCRCKMQREKSK